MIGNQHAIPAPARPFVAVTTRAHDRATAKGLSGPLFRCGEAGMIVAAKRRSKKARSPVILQPSGWMDIQVGAIVLASIAPRPTEWFEVLVTGLKPSAVVH